MANLGNLFYSVYLKDMTDADKEKIRKKVESMTAKLDVTVSSSTIQKAVKAALSGHTFKADITPNIKKSGLGKVDIAANSTNIRKSINDALKGQTFKAHVNMVVDKAKVDDAIKKAFARAGMRYDTTASDLRAAKIAAIQTKAEAAAASSRELTRQRAARAAKAELDLANARDRSSSAARRHVSATLSMNGAMSSQLSIAGQLRNEFLSLYSIYAVQNFLRAVVDIGGELENQRIAMSSILQDAGKATTIFNQIKSLAVASPFGVMDLNQYSKQLSAYSVPYNELYDTMKRLADISAGVGVDMGRIILAYGQIKAAKFLKGTELRQLTEANIPMVDKLSERFSKLEGRIVSAGEVLEMISKKKVTFEDVKDVLWELTDEGGMFNNMQEALSQSVKSKWKNLADAIDIMLGDIAESMGSTLKWTAESLTALAQNWKELVPVIQAAVGAFGAYKAATFMSSRLFGSEYKSITQSILANKRLTAEKLRVEAAYRRLTVAEQQLIATSNKLTYADYEQMAVSGQLTKNKLMLLVAMKKLTAVQAESIALQAKMGRLNVSNSSYIGMMNVGVKALWGSLKNLGAAMVGLINPFTITFAGLELIFTLLHKSGQKADEMNERISELTTKAQEGFKSLTKEAQKFADVDPFNANDASLISSIEKIKTALKDYSPVWAETFNEAFKTDDEGKAVKSLAEQYILLRDALNDTRDAYKLLNDIKGTAEHANETTDGYFDESFSENIKDYIKAEKRVEKVIGRMTGSYIEYSTAMQKVIDKHKDFANAALGKPLKEQLHIIKEYPKALSSLNNELPLMYRDDVFQLRKAWGISKRVLDEDVLPDMEKFMSEYRSRLRAAGWDLDNLNQAQKIAIGLDIRAFLDQFEKMKAHTREFFNERLLEKGFNIKVNVEYTETVQAISDLQKKFNEATDGKFEAQIKVSTDSEKIIEGIQKAYKEAKETTNQLKPILIKAGIDFSGIDAIDLSKLPEWQKQIVSDYRKALGIVRAGDEGSKELGFSLTDTSKDKKDAFAEKMKERVNLLKDAYSEYKKWSGLIGKEEAAKKIKESGIFDSLFKGKEPVNIDNYRDELNKIFNQLDDKTKERRELKVSIQKVLFDIDADAMKEASDKALKEVEEYIAEITKRWDFYKQLYGTTGDKNWAMNIAFSNPTYFDEAATQMVDS
ncbi:phage tape measure [Bacteroides pyogenes DSM 20611 = JCM 6294]|uniref:Phage tape measure n=3 Tax=Bacteroides pyogenes TaxID=310300 RepID=W4PDB3_9BACE|nr:phage tape measure [Bacteroides pyogenes DSM 20611 = JCM 6294]